MVQSLAECLPTLLSGLPQVILNEEASTSLRSHCRILPARWAMHELGLRVPLGSRCAHAEFWATASRDQEGQALLHEFLASGAFNGQTDSAALAVLGRLQALAEIWSVSPWDRRMDDLKLHWPLSASDAYDFGLPWMWAGPLIERTDDHLWHAWSQQVMPCLLGMPPDKILMELLTHSRACLPEQSSFYQLGVSPQWPAHSVYVAVQYMGLDQVLDYLKALGLALDFEALSGHFRWLQRFANEWTLQLAIPTRGAFSMKLSCSGSHTHHAAQQAQDWALILQGLEAFGLCQPEKNQALQTAVSILCQREHALAWPHEAEQLQHLMARESVFRRYIKRIEIEFNSSGPTQAWAQLAFRHDWGRPFKQGPIGHC
jgi:hypothetical protein